MNAMRWTCPKCGKKLEISNEQLIAGDGIIVCPQCLLQAHQPIPKARLTDRKDKPSTPPKRRKESISFDNTGSERESSTPPPYNRRMKQTTPSYRHTATGSDSGYTAPKRKSSTGKKKGKKKKKQQPMSAWGCLGRSIVFTLILFAVYVFFGLLLESLQ